MRISSKEFRFKWVLEKVHLILDMKDRFNTVLIVRALIGEAGCGRPRGRVCSTPWTLWCR